MNTPQTAGSATLPVYPEPVTGQELDHEILGRVWLITLY
jgi:hypothetical protein